MPVGGPSIGTVTGNWDMTEFAPGIPCLSCHFVIAGTQNTPNSLDFAMGPEETGREGMNMGLLPVFEVTDVKNSYRYPSRKEVAKELETFLRDQAARNAVSRKCLEDIWESAEKPSTGGNWTYMKWPEMTEGDGRIPRVSTGKTNTVAGWGGGSLLHPTFRISTNC